MNLLVIGIGRKKDWIIGYRYWLKCLISCIPKKLVLTLVHRPVEQVGYIMKWNTQTLAMKKSMYVIQYSSYIFTNHAKNIH